MTYRQHSTEWGEEKKCSNISIFDNTDAPLDNEISPLCQAHFSAGASVWRRGQKEDRRWLFPFTLSTQMFLQMWSGSWPDEGQAQKEKHLWNIGRSSYSFPWIVIAVRKQFIRLCNSDKFYYPESSPPNTSMLHFQHYYSSGQSIKQRYQSVHPQQSCQTISCPPERNDRLKPGSQNTTQKLY